jgi:hypothetical protein
LSWPGFAFASAMSSLIECTGKFGFVTTTNADDARIETWLKSFTTSYGTLLYTLDESSRTH